MATMNATFAPRPVAGRIRSGSAALIATFPLAVALCCVTWIVLAAAQRPSVLAPPSIRGDHTGGWVLGPLSGLLPHLTTVPSRLSRDWLIAMSVLAVAWLAAWVSAAWLPTRVVAGAIALAHGVLFLGPPQQLTDAFNYLVYGQEAVHGINPYVVVPAVAAHSASAYPLSNWHHLPSPYGPVFTLLCEPLGLLGLHAGLWAWKAVALACSLATLALVWWLARRLGRSPQRALVAVGLCPVVLVVGFGGFHNDPPAVLCLVAAVACLVRARDAGAGPRWDIAAGALGVLAAGVKPSFAVVVPLLVLGVPRRRAAIAGAAVAAALVGLVVLVAFGGRLPAIGLQSRIVTPLSIPNLLGVAAGHGGSDPAVRRMATFVLAAVVALACLAVLRVRERALSAIGVVLFVTVLTLSWVMPWYLVWALPLVAVGRPRLLVPAVVVATVWLGVGGLSELPQILHWAGYYPTRLPTGLENHDFLRTLLT